MSLQELPRNRAPVLSDVYGCGSGFARAHQPYGARTNFRGKVAVITGGADPMSFALALCAAREGMNVVLAGDDEPLLDDALEQVRRQDVRAIAVHTDTSDADAVRALARQTQAELGTPWLVCNNAPARFSGLGRRLVRRNPKPSIDGNLWSIINGVQVFAPILVASGAGHIVNIASTSLFGSPGEACYVASTHAIVGLSESLYRELDSMGSKVGVTLVCPALGNTNINSAVHGGACRSEGNHQVPRSEAEVSADVLTADEIAREILGAIRVRNFRLAVERARSSAPSLRL